MLSVNVPLQQVLQSMREIFEAADTDKSGKLDKDPAKDVRKVITAQVPCLEGHMTALPS